MQLLKNTLTKGNTINNKVNTGDRLVARGEKKKKDLYLVFRNIRKEILVFNV